MNRTRPADAQQVIVSSVRTPQQHIERSLPQPLEEGASVTLAHRLYMIGGLDAAGNDSSAVFVFEGRRWANGPRLPLALDHLAATVLENKIYVVGGFGASGASDRVFVLPAGGRSWTSAGRLNQPRGALALVAFHGLLFALGGKDSAGVERNTVEVSAIDAGHWHVLSTRMPAPRDHLTGFVYHDSVCVAGGRSPNTARVDCYNPQHRVWWRLPDLPVATSGAGGTTYRGRPTIGGGELATEGGGVIPQLTVFSNNRWIVFRMLIPRHGIQFSQFGGRIWVCGGADRPGLHPVATCTSIG